MCGIFGFVSRDGEQFEPKLLSEMAIDTESRGPHAYGFAWVDSRNRMRMFKGKGRLSQHLGALAMAADAKMLIGHCRYATHGSPDNNLNNHPHPCDGGWIVHNGVIGDHQAINKRFELAPVTQCDSETLALLIERLDGTLVDRVSWAVQECATSSLAMMGLWRNPLRMVAARDGNPLHISKRKTGYYLASNASAMPAAFRVKDQAVVAFDIAAGETRIQQFDLADVIAQF